MRKQKKNKSSRVETRQTTQGTQTPESPEPDRWESEKAGQRSRQESFAARERATRTQLSAGQTKVQRLHRGNQPRGA
jgi:hypothetical protein